jgi:hypothetical protein
MAKFTDDTALDAHGDSIALANILHVCSTQPANYAGIAAVSLADVAMTPGVGNGDYTRGDGDVSGRKITVLAQTAIPVDATGSAGHLALAVTGSSRLCAVTTCTAQGLTSGNTVNTPAYDHEVNDPS